MKSNQFTIPEGSRRHSSTSSNVVLVSLVLSLLVLLLAVAGVGYYIWYGMQHTPASTTHSVIEQADVEQVSDATEVDKLELLNQLQKNPDNLTTEEKRAILERL